jgi:diguanylate cyclase (GGDEF)-like protein
MSRQPQCMVWNLLYSQSSLRIDARKGHGRGVMEDSPSRLNMFALSRGVALALGTCMLLGAAIVDYATTAEISLSAFYLFAILTVTWNCGVTWGTVFAAIALAFQIALGLLQGHPYSSNVYFFYAQGNVLFEYSVAVFLTTQLRRLFERERHTARVDMLTGVRNRQGFHEVLESEIERHARKGASFCLAYIDVDDFKGVNDRYGHAEGDRLLEAVGHVTAKSIRRSDTVGRLGGDEFAVLFPDTNQAEALAIEYKLRAALTTITQPRPWWSVSFSVGIATFVSMPRSADAAMAYVDQLMYRAKRAGKSTTVSGVYDDATFAADSTGTDAFRRQEARDGRP